MEKFDIQHKDNFLSAEECEYISWILSVDEKWDYISIPSPSVKLADWFTTLQYKKYSSSALQRLSMQIYRKTQDFVNKGRDSQLHLAAMFAGVREVGTVAPFTPFGSYFPPMSTVAIVLLGSHTMGENVYMSLNKNKVEATPGGIIAYQSGGLADVFEAPTMNQNFIISAWSTNELSTELTQQIDKMKSYLDECCNEEQPVVKPQE